MIEQVKTIIENGIEIRIITKRCGYTPACAKACKKYYEANKQRVLEKAKVRYDAKKLNTV